MYTYHIMHNGAFYWEKCIDAKITSTGARSNSTHMATTYISQMSNFCPFDSMTSRFWVTSQFWMAPNYLDMFKIKSIYMHTTYTPGAQFSTFSLYDEPLYDESRPLLQKVHCRMTPIFVRFSLRWAVFELRSDLQKSAPNDLDMLKVKNTNMHMLHAPPMPKFLSVSLYDEPFWVTGHFRKNAPNDPKWTWHIHCEKYQHACYIHPPRPNFRPFHSTMSHFWVMPKFRKSAPNVTKWPWHDQGQKYQNACCIHPWCPNFVHFALR